MKFFTLLSISFIVGISSSDAQPVCIPPQRVDSLHANAIKAYVSSDLNIFEQGRFGFRFPANSSDENKITGLIHNLNFIVGGYASQGDWRVSTGSYSGNWPSFIPGYINGPSGLDEVDCLQWGQVWKVNGYDIAGLKADFEDNGIVDSSVPNSLLSWPGRGNPFIKDLMGISLPDQPMAPFYDANQDGIYNPYQGDYPVIGLDCQDLIPTQLLWTIAHDIPFGDPINQPGGPMGLEIQLTAFALDFPSIEDILKETVFLRLEIKNLSGTEMSDVRICQWLDVDIGCSNDDYVGCAPGSHTVFGYNGSDKDFCPTGSQGFDMTPPVLTMTILGDTLLSFISGFRGHPGDFWSSSDSIPLHRRWENILSGKKWDGKSMTVGGDGFTGMGDTTTFQYSGLPSDTGSWSMQNISNSNFGDIRLAATSLGQSLEVGESAIQYIAYSAHRKADLLPPYQVDYALSRIPYLQDFYQNCFTLPIGNPIPCQVDCVWPGDMDANGMCNNLDLLEWGVSLDRTGSDRGQPFIGWLPQYALGWGNTGELDTDARHQDANGDGVINQLDVFAIHENFGKTNTNPVDWGGFSLEGPEVKLTRLYNGLTSPDEVVTPGKKFMIQFDVQEWPSDSIYSLGYSIIWDTLVVRLEPGFDQLPKASPLVDNSEVFLHIDGNRIDIGITRTDHVNLAFSPFELGKVLFRIRPDVPQGQAPDSTVVVVQHTQAYLANGTELIIGSEPLAIPFGIVTSLDDQNSLQSAMSIHPNPSDGLVTWTSGRPLKELRLYTVDGNLVQHWALPGKQNMGQLNLQLPGGVYLLLGQAMDGTIHRVRMILR